MRFLEVPWSGRPLEGDVVAWDTETTVVDLRREVPALVCLSASNGERSVVVFRDQVENFFLAHQDKPRLVAHNIGFDWWVVFNHLPQPGCAVAAGSDPHIKKWLGKAVDDGQFGDTMLLEQLVRLAEGRDSVFFGQPLAQLAKTYLGRELVKEDAVRLGFTVEMSTNWQNPAYQKGWAYAAEDAQTTYELDKTLRERARTAVSRLPFRPPTTDWGLLTERIQVRAAIALAQTTRNGIGVDAVGVQSLTDALSWQADQAASLLTSVCPGIVHVWPPRAKKGKPGSPKYTASGQPQFNFNLLRGKLEGVAKELGLEKPPRTEKTGVIQLTGDWWHEHAPDHPFVGAWVGFQQATQSLKFLHQLEGDRVHSRYTTTVRTGRTSASDPPIQQVPRGAEFRKLFVAGPGKVLVAADYSFIELVTLAAVCQERLGVSELGNVLRGGIDPHKHTARLVLGLSDDAYEVLGPAEKKAARQKAKPLNFGIPGGLGPKKLRSYAKLNYGVEFSAEEAKALRLKVITEVYPEWERWLLDGLAVRLSYSLGCSVAAAQNVFGVDSAFLDPMNHPAARVFAGNTTREDGVPFASYFVETVWRALEHCVEGGDGRCGPSIFGRICNRVPGPDLAAFLFSIPSVTLTGRSRARTMYGDWRNTQFQGLAADGAKLALWDLTKAAYKIVAFVHDEVVIEIEESETDYGPKRIAEIMERAFARVVPGDLPVRVETAVGRSWTKP